MVAIVTVAVVVFVMQPGRVIYRMKQQHWLPSPAAHTFSWQAGSEISENEMIIDQTFGNPEYHDNPNVKIKLGALFGIW